MRKIALFKRKSIQDKATEDIIKERSRDEYKRKKQHYINIYKSVIGDDYGKLLLEKERIKTMMQADNKNYFNVIMAIEVPAIFFVITVYYELINKWNISPWIIFLGCILTIIMALYALAKEVSRTKDKIKEYDICLNALVEIEKDLITKEDLEK